jgi:hypothetical protein
MKAYENQQVGYKISYPAAWTVRKNANLIGPDALDKGTVFVPPPFDNAGTILTQSEAEIIAQNGGCPTGMVQDVETFNGTPFERVLWADTGGEGISQTLGFQTAKNNKCYRIILFRHTCDLGKSCDANHRKPYSPGPQVQVFMEMVGTFQLL